MVKALEEQNNQNFFLHSLVFQTNAKFSLAKAAKLVKNKPCLVISVTGSEVKGKSVVPVHLVTENFNAEKWLTEVAEVVKGQVKAPRGQDQDALQYACRQGGRQGEVDFRSSKE